MDTDKSIFELVDYGKIVIDVKTLMDKKNITINSIVRKTGIHHRVVTRYYNGDVTRYDGDILAKLCYVLECDLSDIMRYKR